MSYSTVGKQLIIAKSKQKSTVASHMYRDLLDGTKYVDHVPTLRPSTFPICSIILLDSLLYEREWSFMADMYTSMGTAIHETIQAWCSKSNMKIWGNWFCPICRERKTYTHKSFCKKCEDDMIYIEIEVEYLGVKGHIDLIVLDGEKGFIIVDVKSCGDYTINQPTYAKLSLNYVLQLSTYAYMIEKIYGDLLEKKYGHRVGGCSLLFVNRKKPSNIREFYWDRETVLKLGQKTIHKNIISFNKGMKAYDTGDLNTAVNNRLCHNKQHYEEEVQSFFFGGCYLADVCIKGKKKDLKKHFKELDFG